MINEETALQYIKELLEYTNAGNQLVEICACEDKNEVVRRQWRIETLQEQVLTVEQVKLALIQKDAEKDYLLALKAQIEEEKEKLFPANDEVVE